MFPGWSVDSSNESAGDYLYRITITATHKSGVNVAMTRLYFDQTEAEQAASQNSSSGSSGSASSSGSSSSSGSAAGGS
jgi:hypothetical protein